PGERPDAGANRGIERGSFVEGALVPLENLHHVLADFETSLSHRFAPPRPVQLADGIKDLHDHYTDRSSRVRSPAGASPVFPVPFGSMRRTWASGSAFGQCSTPFGTT